MPSRARSSSSVRAIIAGDPTVPGRARLHRGRDADAAAAPGGAAARPFITHHNALDMRPLPAHRPRALPQAAASSAASSASTRSAATSATRASSTKHNPEFTMLELYQAYADYDDMMRLVEEMIADAARPCTAPLNVTFGEHDDRPHAAVAAAAPSRGASRARRHRHRATTARAGRSPAARSCAARHGVPRATAWGRGRLDDAVRASSSSPSSIQPTFVTDYPRRDLAARQAQPRRPALRRAVRAASSPAWSSPTPSPSSTTPTTSASASMQQVRDRAAGDEEAHRWTRTTSGPWSTACRPPAASAWASTAW